MLYVNTIISLVFSCSLLLCLVAIVYWVLKPGKVKHVLKLWILAGNRLLLIAGMLYFLLWTIGFIGSWYNGVEYEQYAFLNRISGPYWWAYWSMLIFSFTPQLFWFSKIRNSVFAALIISILVNWGLIVERLVIIITNMHRDYLPSSWNMYHLIGFSALDILIYMALLAPVYWFLRSKQKHQLIS